MVGSESNGLTPPFSDPNSSLTFPSGDGAKNIKRGGERLMPPVQSNPIFKRLETLHRRVPPRVLKVLTRVTQGRVRL